MGSCLSKGFQGLDYTLRELNADTALVFAKYLPLHQLSIFSRTSKSNHQIVQPIVDKLVAVHPLLLAVVHRSLEKLVELIALSPALLFQKGQVTDPNGRTFTMFPLINS